MSDVIDGAIVQWRRLNSRLAEIEEELKDAPASMKMLQELRKAHNSATKLLPELIRVMALLDGGATSRTDTVIGGRRTKDMTYEEMEEVEEAEARRIIERADRN